MVVDQPNELLDRVGVRRGDSILQRCRGSGGRGRGCQQALLNDEVKLLLKLVARRAQRRLLLFASVATFRRLTTSTSAD